MSGREECTVLTADLVAAYASGVIDPVAAWSVEAHLPGCESCRAVLTGQLDGPRLARSKSLVLTRLAVPEPGLTERLLARLGLPPYLWRLLTVTPSLRLPWLAGLVLVLAITLGAAWLFDAGMHLLGPHGAGGSGGAALRAPGRSLALLPFLLLAPVLPLAGIAAAFDRRFDPSQEILRAAPLSGIRLFLVRSVAVIGVALLPTMAAALALPVSPWTAVAIALPALAVSAAGLALSTVTTPLRAAGCAGAAWVAVVTVATVSWSSPALVIGPGAQLVAGGVLVAAAWLAGARHRALGFG
jgi:hypothetical protein